MQKDTSLDASLSACRNWRNLDYLIELRERVSAVRNAKDSLTLAYENLAEWITEGESQRTKFAAVRELLKIQGVSDCDLFIAIETKLNKRLKRCQKMF